MRGYGDYFGATKLIRGGVPLVCVGSFRNGVRGVALTTANITTMAKPKTVPSFVSMDISRFPQHDDCRIAQDTFASAKAYSTTTQPRSKPAEQANLV